MRISHQTRQKRATRRGSVEVVEGKSSFLGCVNTEAQLEVLKEMGEVNPGCMTLKMFAIK